jgi:hypothetical protein
MEKELVPVVNVKTGRKLWFAHHLANDDKYMKSVGFMKAQIEPIKPIETKKEVIEDEDIVDEFASNTKPTNKINRKQTKK